MMNRGKGLKSAKLRHLNRTRHTDPRKIIAQKIDDHDILGAVLAALGQRPRLQSVENGIGEAAARALDRPGFDTIRLDFEKSFRRGRGNDEILMVEIGRKRSRIAHAQALVKAEIVEIIRYPCFKPLRHIGLKNIASREALDHP